MSKQTNNRIVNNNNKSTESKPKFRKCVHHVLSHNYAANIKKHDDIIEKAAPFISSMNMDETINVKILFHFLAPIGSYNREKVMSRAHDVIMSINDDFNNYTNNQNTMNNFKYKSIVNQIFASNMAKQNVYLGQNYLKFLPLKPSNITFELGEIYYYPVKNKLNLSKYDDEKDVEIQFQVIKQYIHQNRADAINPENFVNIWIIDMTDTTVLGYSNFPWEIIDNFHGIIIHRRCFFPEDYQETNYSGYKTFSHELGHYFGLLHVGGGMEAYLSPNINAESEKIDLDNESNKIYYLSDPLDKTNCKNLHSDMNYNPLFMNFMDFTHDKYVTMFTNNQLQKMRYMINSYRPKINSNKFKTKILVPKYNPETNTITSTTDCKQSLRPTKSIPSYETTDNPRLNSHNQPQTNNQSNQQSNQQYNQQFNQQSNQQPMPSIHPSYTEYIASQTVPNLQPVPSKPKTEINLPIHLLAPNLCGYSSKNSSNNDIISNIQNNIPVYEDEVIDKDAAAYQEFLNNYKKYNSDNGYAMSYPYDPYTIQEYYKNMAAIQKYGGQQASPNNDPRLNTYAAVPSQQQSQTQQNIQLHMPQYQTQQNIQPQYQTQSQMPQYQTQSQMPQYQTQSNMPQSQTQQNVQMHMPQYQTPQSNIQSQYYTQPNTQNQYPYSQNMTDPKIIQNLTTNQLNIDQINKQQPQQTQIPINNQNKRTDPQFSKPNLQNQRTIPKSVNTEIHTETESSGIPSNLLNRINNLDQQVKNVKINDISKIQPSTKPTASISTQPEAKYNKYGQTSKVHTNNFVANKLKNNDNVSGKIPKTRFQRYKPSGV
ncbi:hypothetical protein [Powai lake megavirus]|uniref:Uncharacterized protein n=1 Tax=Powai lake megavirus TaxID=1842663 RepID=A0A167R7M1_9VIRU|nr:hypothetical protein QJ849_gp232 [Powai lake megavirus]ANB50394.1 hypothetical protein [Powai lake megavirus]